MPQATAAFALGLIGGLSIPGRMGCGLISDAIGWQKTVKISLIGTGAAILALPLVTNQWALIGVMALFGFWHGARAVGVMGLVGQVFRMRAVGQMIGTIIGAAQLVGAMGPYLAGLLHDYTGSYTTMFVGLGIATILVSFVAPRAPTPEEMEA